MSECRKETSKITTDVENLKNLAEDCLGEYLNEYYSTYGVDDIASGLLNVIAELEVIRCKLEYAEIKERWAPV